MALNDNDRTILEEVVATQGACLESKRCQKCPFRAMCLPEFLFPNRPTQTQRLELALNVLTHHALIEDEASSEDIKEYKWDKR